MSIINEKPPLLLKNNNVHSTADKMCASFT